MRPPGLMPGSAAPTRCSYLRAECSQRRLSPRRSAAYSASSMNPAEPSAPSARSGAAGRPQPTTRPRTCVIGAGSSGLVACKALADRGLNFSCFEASDREGGLWVFGNRNGQSAAYRSLHINTSRKRMQLADHPMPASYPDYPRHELIAEYLASYATRFDLRRHVRFSTRVERVTPRAGGGYTVELDDGSQHAFDRVIVANGHHWHPRLPEPAIPGSFDGVELHSHSYVAPDEPYALRGKRVVVVGIGNSAVDIACELGANGGRVFLAVRRGAWVLPRYALGRPLDRVSGSFGFVPRAISRWLAERWYHLAVGAPSAFGLPTPDHRLGDAHPTVSSELLSAIGCGKVTPKPALTKKHGSQVWFADGSSEAIDAIVYATGYHVSFPFFEPSFVSAPNNELALFFRIFPPTIPHLYFIGLAQPLGPIFPIAEAQAKLVAAEIAGEYRLPEARELQRAAERQRRSVRERFGDSPRHTMQLDFDDYLRALSKERKLGEGRARAAR